MHHIPRFFVHSKRNKDMDPKKNRRKPKLERRNALKDVEYDAASSSSSLDDSSGSFYTRSMELSDRTSFRIEGIEGEVDRICQSLGLSGPEDFSIPTAAWEAMKMRSSSDILPRSKLDEFDSLEREVEKEKDESQVVVDLNDRFQERVNIWDATEFAQSQPAETSGCCIAGGGVCGVGGGGGIKGVRPPLLKPPPSMRLPVIDKECSTWDLFRDFAPQNESTTKIREELGSSDEDEETGREVENEEKATEVDGIILKSIGEDDIARIHETAVLSESSSFTTSNDDDSSSTTTEPTSSNISPNGKFRWNIKYWEKGQLLGRGSFGSVYEGIADGGFFFAIKEVSLLDQGSQGKQSVYQLEQEIALLSQFEHENIVQYYGTDKDESKLYIFLELVTLGSLGLLYRRFHLRDSQVSAYTRQILHGLKYLHDRNVIHRDVKCANILVDASGSVKLADFGLAKATKLNDVKSCKGTAFWMAPEVVRGRNQGYGLPADIWSLGCTVLEMLTGQIPYYHLECMQALFRIGKGELPRVPDSLSTDARDFILQCLQVNPDDRPTAAQLLNHQFVKRQLPTSFGSPYHPGRRLELPPSQNIQEHA
ncbi:Protein kinase [Quillaja saponaria]|uniref:mitogen-activated protein kinase kinase kinase n=1 Tax=Quillaja saponaria TaxID=32244 RepID=A0AAD7LJ18_QUISA|nr:Protein kinase [Quillaja saponaria]